jgi:hypothetical protein
MRQSTTIGLLLIALLVAACERPAAVMPDQGTGSPTLPSGRDRFAASVRIEADGKPIRGGYAPAFGDIDGDDRPDLVLGGDSEGRLAVYRNIGPPHSPRLTGSPWFDDQVPTGRIPKG